MEKAEKIEQILFLCYTESHKDLSRKFLWLHTLTEANSSKSRVIHQQARYMLCTSSSSALTRKPSSHRPNQPESDGRRRNPNSVEPFSLLLLFGRIPLLLCAKRRCIHSRPEYLFEWRWDDRSANAAALNTSWKSRRAYIYLRAAAAASEMRERLLAAAGSIWLCRCECSRN